MKIIKYVLQILGAAALAFVVTWLLSRLIGLVFGWLLSLPNFWMLVVLVFGETILIGVLFSVASIISVPFLWTNNKNIVAVIISSLIVIIQIVLWIIYAWQLPHHGFIPFITWFFVLTTVVLLGIGLIMIEVKCYKSIEQ